LMAGRRGAGVTKGYFPSQKNRRGRQLGRVIATHYGEILCFKKYGVQRTVSDVLQIPGCAQLDSAGRVHQIILNDRHPCAAACH
jgi:hypothetical protein